MKKIGIAGNHAIHPNPKFGTNYVNYIQKNYTAASEIIFRESTTLGLRISKIKRAALNRKIKLVSTAYGQIHCKIAYYNGKISNISAEYEDCRALAKKKNVPIREVQHEALRIAYYLADNRK